MEALNIIRKEGNEYVLYSHKGKVLGRHKTRKDAEAQEAAIEVSKHAGSAEELVIRAGALAGRLLLGKYEDETARDVNGRYGNELQASERARTASKSAKDSESHLKAAKLHRAAARAYSKAGNKKRARHHLSQANEHEMKALD